MPRPPAGRGSGTEAGGAAIPVYRLHGSDGTTQTITAARVVVVEEEVRFQSSNGDGWVVGYTSIGLCRTCDADELEHSQQHNATGVLPKELPTVDPRTLDQTRRHRST